MPVWTYGIQLWGCTKKDRYYTAIQNKGLKAIVNASWNIRNDDIHRDLNIELVERVIKKCA